MKLICWLFIIYIDTSDGNVNLYTIHKCEDVVVQSEGCALYIGLCSSPVTLSQSVNICPCFLPSDFLQDLHDFPSPSSLSQLLLCVSFIKRRICKLSVSSSLRIPFTSLYSFIKAHKSFTASSLFPLSIASLSCDT